MSETSGPDKWGPRQSLSLSRQRMTVHIPHISQYLTYLTYLPYLSRRVNAPTPVVATRSNSKEASVQLEICPTNYAAYSTHTVAIPQCSRRSVPARQPTFAISSSRQIASRTTLNPPSPSRVHELVGYYNLAYYININISLLLIQPRSPPVPSVTAFSGGSQEETAAGIAL